MPRCAVSVILASTSNVPTIHLLKFKKKVTKLADTKLLFSQQLTIAMALLLVLIGKDLINILPP